MIDINKEAQKALSNLKYTVVYQYPADFNDLPVVSYYNLSETGGFYADNTECIQNGYVQIDIWSDTGAKCGEISIEVNEVMERDGWTRKMSMDVPKKNEKIYHRTMRFYKSFVL